VARRAFELFESEGHAFGREMEHWLKAEREFFHPVLTELNETEKAFTLKAEVPGFTEKDLEIKAEPQRVVITGKQEGKTEEEKKGKIVRSEIFSNEIMRVVELPAEIEAEKATATVKNGVLTMAMPKAAKARTVTVKPAAA